MALLAEALVDEWLNRRGFFTVRGVRHGVEEIDLLGVRPNGGGHDAWHVEVQASFRPLGYLSPMPKDLAAELGVNRRSAKKRSDDLVKRCAQKWVESKFFSASKKAARERAWPGLSWRPIFVHAEMRYPLELEVIGSCSVELIPLHRILSELRHELAEGVRGGAGTDLAEIIEYFDRHSGSARSEET